MRYIISNNVALHSWKLVPCACYVRGHQYAQRLSREQFELRTHKRLIDILNPTPQTMDALTKLDLPAGVEIEIKL